ncbi:MAG: DUF3131 domain-containing protein [Oscillospiraceae bacterium]|jgi:cyclic beta-1,2-glucan synthetase|nr:DUF3131 domain-containing protein [Oscillospiraceae bacterium]
MRIEWIVLLGIGLIAAMVGSILSARASRGKEERLREAALPQDALLRHITAQAAGMGGTSFVRMRAIPWAAESLRVAYSACAALGSAAPLTPAAQWLCDNARTLEEAAVSVNDALKSSPRLPSRGGVARVEALAREMVSHMDARVDPELLMLGARAYQQAHQLTEDELWALPTAARRAIVILAARIAKECVTAERARLTARTWAERLGAMAPEKPSAAFRRAARHPAFIEQLLSELLEREDAAGLNWMDAYLATVDQTAERAVSNEHMRQTRARDWMGNAVTSLKRLGAMEWDTAQEELSAAHAALLNDPAGVYANMDFASRCMYRGRVARIAKKARQPEALTARRAIALAQESSEDAIAGHVGYYLIDDGQPRLWKMLGGAPFSVKIFRAIRRISVPLFVSSIAVLDILLVMAFRLLGAPIWALVLSLPLLGEASRALLQSLITRVTRPVTLPRIAPEHIETRTLVVVPTLIASRKQAIDMARHLSVLRFANPQEGVEYMLLADFADADTRDMPDDAAIVGAAAEAVEALNQVWGGGYHYIHRRRAWDEGMRRFMGPDRKRGALEALNQWIVEGVCSCELAASTVDPAQLRDRYKAVITLDADTQLPPDTALTLVGALAHPLNTPCAYLGKIRGHAILQPRMEVSSGTVRSRLGRVYGGDGGVDLYVTAASDLYQNLAGAGSFGGKGVYDPVAFHHAVKGRIRRGTILSHDLLEGCLARAALLSDVPLYDGQPQSLSSWYKRQHRWTRGDWQLLPWLGARIRGESATFPNPLDLLSRYKIYDNLRRSVLPIFELALWIGGFATGSTAALLIALVPVRLGCVIRPSVGAVRAACVRLALLPGEAKVQLDAVLRTIGRVMFTHRNMLEWVTSAQSEKAGEKRRSMERSPAWIAAVGIVAGAAFHQWFLMAAVPMACAWLAAPGIEAWLDGLAWSSRKPTDEQNESLREIARDTWRFFERTVNEHTSFLPPDNVQTDPPRGAAPRTSPTNIGMYMLSCSGALSLGFITAQEFLERISSAVTTVERLETWRGHPLNWYDTRTLEPLRPRYVSSVDSGNFAVCATAAAQIVRSAINADDGSYTDLPTRLEALVDRIDFQALYDTEASLFYVGVDAESGIPGNSRYDLLASEARMLSFFAVMRREAPLKHWRALGRTLTAAFPISARGGVLLSWAGTAFEYLMPLILFPHIPGTLLGDSSRNAVRAQMAQSPDRPWGVSESGYYAFDPELNYQYKAFGLPALSLRGGAPGAVVAPYASALALPVSPRAAAENLICMRKLGWYDEQGLFEAADWDASRIPPTRSYAIVRSHMAHHQGMILCSIANHLTDGALVRAFSGLPQTEAYALLLEEKTPTRSMLKHAVRPRYMAPPHARLNAHRAAAIDAWPVAVQLMHGAGTTLMCDAHGNGYLAHQGVMLTRWRPDPTERENGLRLYIRADGGSAHAIGAYSDETVFDSGLAETSACVFKIEARVARCVSPMDGAVVFDVRLRNAGLENRSVELITFAEVALSAQQADVAHPAFRNLFVETARPSPRVLIARRRPRSNDENFPVFAHWVGLDGTADIYAETDRSAFIKRGDALPVANAAGQGKIGAVVDPCLSFGVRLSLAPEGETRLLFGWAAADSESDAICLAEKYTNPGDAQRALSLAATQAEVTARHLGLDPARQISAQTIASYLLYHGQPANRQDLLARNAQGVAGLWAMGISGDLPIVAACINKASETSLARLLLRCHEYLRRLGLWFDLALLAEGEDGYDHPVRDALREAVAASSARDLIGKPSGVFLLDTKSLRPDQTDTLFACSALTFHGGDGTLAAQLTRLRRSTPGVSQTMQRANISNVKPNANRLRKQRRRQYVASAETFTIDHNAFPNALSGEYPHIPLKPIGALEAENGYGGFAQDDSYVISQGAVPLAPWCNVLANPSFGAIITDRGSGFSWVGNSGLGRLTAFRNDPIRDRASDAIYIRDEETGAYRSATPAPCGNPARIRHAQGYSVFESDALGLSTRLTIFADAEKPALCRMLQLRNPGARERKISITAFTLWNYRSEGETRLLSTGVTDGVAWARHAKDGRTLFSSMIRTDMGGGMTIQSASTDGIAFLGTGGAQRPRAMEMREMDSIGGELPCAAIRGIVTIAPGQEVEICALIGAEEL